jgi:hypothetical protein
MGLGTRFEELSYGELRLLSSSLQAYRTSVLLDGASPQQIATALRILDQLITDVGLARQELIMAQKYPLEPIDIEILD